MVGKLAMNIAIFLLFVTAAGATDGLIVSTKVDPQLRDEAQKIYVSACRTVELEYGAGRSIRPRVSLLLGADQDSVDWGRGEIRLRDWDPNLFAQGVITLAYRQILPLHVSLNLTETLRVRSFKEQRRSHELRFRARQPGPANRLA